MSNIYMTTNENDIVINQLENDRIETCNGDDMKINETQQTTLKLHALCNLVHRNINIQSVSELFFDGTSTAKVFSARMW